MTAGSLQYFQNIFKNQDNMAAFMASANLERYSSYSRNALINNRCTILYIGYF